MIKEFKKMFRFFNFNALEKEIGGYGYDFKWTQFIALVISIPIATSLIGYVLKLKWYLILLLILLFIFLLPTMILNKFKYQYEQRRFSETNSYMEQMIYSFKKKDKILTSLEDTRELANHNMARVLDKAINWIDRGISKGNIYREALGFIENDYSCSRIKTLHAFLIEIEENGGDYQHSLTILLQDIQDWSKRIRLQQQNRSNLQKKVLLSIILAMVTCCSMLLMIPADYTTMITSKMLYQITTTFVLASCIVLYVYTEKKLSGNYLADDDDLMSQEEYKKYYIDATHYDMKKARKKSIINFFAMMIVSVASFIVDRFVSISLQFSGIVFALLAIFMLFQPYLHQKTAKKKTIREIEKVFPMWIRTLILHLQSDNITVSLYNSLATCPVAIKRDVIRLVKEIQQYPGEISPYLHFMQEFEGCHDMKASVKNLYALAEFGGEDLTRQLDHLIQQNQELMEHAEEMANEDRLAGLSTLILAPMLFAILKLLVDLWIFSSSFMGYLGGFQF